MNEGNLFSSIPNNLDKEVIQSIIHSDNIKIERIISRGHITPKNQWYDQDQNEWVIILKGSGKLVLEEKGEILLNEGDYINIPAHTRHRVIWTQPNTETIWLAIHY